MARIFGDKPYRPEIMLLGGLTLESTLALNRSLYQASTFVHHDYVPDYAARWYAPIDNRAAQSAQPIVPRIAFLDRFKTIFGTSFGKG